MSDHIDRLREEERDQETEQIINERAQDQDDADETADAEGGPVGELGQELGTKGNDIEQFDLLQTDVSEMLDDRYNREPNPEVGQALQDLEEIPVREAVEEADS